jgi:serine/threonine protein kinase
MMLYEATLGRFPAVAPKGPKDLSYWDIHRFLSHDIPVNVPDRYSPELVDVIRKCLRSDPAARCTAAELEAHPWFTSQKREEDAAGRALMAWIAENGPKHAQLKRSLRVTLSELGFRAGKK